MKILFLSFSSLVFDETTPLLEPLGGTESAICYLAGALRDRGHDVSFSVVGYVPTDYDANVVIVVNTPDVVGDVRQLFPDAKIILWNHMMPDQAAMKDFNSLRNEFDCVVHVSEKQRSMFNGQRAGTCDSNINVLAWHYGGVVIPNAIAPCFENMYASAEQLLDDKECRGAYISTPFRGLELLADVQEIPIDVYSSMRVYQTADDDYAEMFDRLRHNPALTMHGSLSQPALAHALRKAAFLTYPCTFDECHSIAILEAQAAGLAVITTDKAMKFDGYASVMSSTDDFVTVLKLNVERYKDNPMRFAEEQFEQVKHINEFYTWAKRAVEWEEMLSGLMRREAA